MHTHAPLALQNLNVVLWILHTHSLWDANLRSHVLENGRRVTVPSVLEPVARLSICELPDID